MVKNCPNINSILQPLTVYFSILITHSMATGKTAKLAVSVFTYIASITKLSAEFEWHAILAYHMIFFSRCRREMVQRLYAG